MSKSTSSGPFPGNLFPTIPGGDWLLATGLGLLLLLGSFYWLVLPRLRRGDISVPKRADVTPSFGSAGPARDSVAPLISLLAGAPALAERANRDALLVGLPSALAAAVPRAAGPPADLETMVRFLDEWGALDDGRPAVQVVMEQAARQAPPPIAVQLRERLATAQDQVAKPVDHGARFQLLAQAYDRGDKPAATALATLLPPDYPGVAPILERAQTAAP